jgi:aspartate racemase
VITPHECQRKIVHNTIYNELVKGDVHAQSRENFKDIIQSLSERGAEGVILGCTEIMLLIKQNDTDLPLFDTTTLHAVHAAKMAMKPSCRF